MLTELSLGLVCLNLFLSVSHVIDCLSSYHLLYLTKDY